MKSVFASLKNSFSLSGPPVEDIRLAVAGGPPADEPPKPEIGVPAPPPPAPAERKEEPVDIEAIVNRIGAEVGATVQSGQERIMKGPENAVLAGTPERDEAKRAAQSASGALGELGEFAAMRTLGAQKVSKPPPPPGAPPEAKPAVPPAPPVAAPKSELPPVPPPPRGGESPLPVSASEAFREYREKGEHLVGSRIQRERYREAGDEKSLRSYDEIIAREEEEVRRLKDVWQGLNKPESPGAATGPKPPPPPAAPAAPKPEPPLTPRSEAKVEVPRLSPTDEVLQRLAARKAREAAEAPPIPVEIMDLPGGDKIQVLERNAAGEVVKFFKIPVEKPGTPPSPPKQPDLDDVRKAAVEAAKRGQTSFRIPGEKSPEAGMFSAEEIRKAVDAAKLAEEARLRGTKPEERKYDFRLRWEYEKLKKYVGHSGDIPSWWSDEEKARYEELQGIVQEQDRLVVENRSAVEEAARDLKERGEVPRFILGPAGMTLNPEWVKVNEKGESTEKVPPGGGPDKKVPQTNEAEAAMGKVFSPAERAQFNVIKGKADRTREEETLYSELRDRLEKEVFASEGSAQEGPRPRTAEQQQAVNEAGAEARKTERGAGFWAKLGHGAGETLTAVLGEAEKSMGGRIMAWWHDKVQNYYMGPALRAQGRLETKQAKVDALQEKVDKYKGTWMQFMADWYQGRMISAKSGLRGAEVQLRKYGALVERHGERRNSYLRMTEGRMREKLRPFEEWANRERQLHGEASKAGEALGKVRDRALQELTDIEAEARSRGKLGGLFLSYGWRQKVNEARTVLRDIDKQISGNEREIATRNARLVRAEAKADPWRAKIARLQDAASESEYAKLNIPSPREANVPGRKPMTRRPVRPAGTPEAGGPETAAEAPRYKSDDFINKWNELRSGDERLDAVSFMQSAGAQAQERQAGGAPERPTMDELLKLVQAQLEPKGIKFTAAQLKQLKSLMTTALRQ